MVASIPLNRRKAGERLCVMMRWYVASPSASIFFLNWLDYYLFCLFYRFYRNTYCLFFRVYNWFIFNDFFYRLFFFYKSRQF